MAMVLVADDSLSVRKVTERLLTQAGMEVFSVESGAEAMRWMNARRPDLIIADVIMMDMSGYEVCSYIRSHATLRDTPVLLISGVVDEEVMRNADDCRANGVIKKPFFGSSLPNRVLELLATAKQTPSAPSQDSSTASKVYRISEGQLQSVRDAMHLIKELEEGLVDERKRAAELEEQIDVLRVTSGEAGRRISDLEARLAEAETQSRQLGNQASHLEDTSECLQKLEARLGVGEGRSQQFADQLQSFHEAMGRVTELESRSGEADERFRQLGEMVHALGEKVGDPAGRIADLEGRIAEAEKFSRQFGEHAGEIGDARKRVQDLEARFAEEEARARQLGERLPSLELIIVEALKTLEARLTAEEGRGQRLAEELPTVQRTVERLPDLDSRLSNEERLTKELREEVQGVQDAGGKALGRITELERRLLEEVARVQKSAEQIEVFGDTVEWIEKLETRLADGQSGARHLGEQVQTMSEKAGEAGAQIAELQTRLMEAETRSRKFEEQVQAVCETGGEVGARIQSLETRLEQEEKRCAQLVERIAVVEPAAASMERLGRALAEIARLALKPGDGTGA